MSGHGRTNGLATRLLVAQTLVAIAGAATLWLVAAAVGPAIFHDHLSQAAVQLNAETAGHIEEAFQSASTISVSVAVFASLVAAFAVSTYVTRRIAAPVIRLAAAARDVTSGRLDVRVPAPGLGSEFADLTGSFNSMAERLETIETTRRRLLADLAHEMRTPVATLDAYLEGVEDGVVTVDSETVAVLRTQTRRLTRLAEDITSMSRAEEGQLDMDLCAVAPRELLTAAVAAVHERFASQEVTLDVQADGDPPPILVDRERIAQVLGNLLDNALRHTPRGGSVRVTARSGGDGRGTVDLIVSDTGEGIPAEHMPHVFERFYRVDTARDRSHGGSGIGLAITKALVEAHGGTVTVWSAGNGRGATFTVHLPAVAPP